MSISEIISELPRTIGIGVVTGIAVTAVLFFSDKYWKRIILPWVEDRFYNDIRIEGQWQTKGIICKDLDFNIVDNGKAGKFTISSEIHNKQFDQFCEIAKIKQRAHYVWGEITYVKEKNESESPKNSDICNWKPLAYKKESESLEYQFEGEIKNLVLNIRCWSKKNNLDRGSATLMIKKNGKILDGFYAWYLNEIDSVIGGPYIWCKSP